MKLMKMLAAIAMCVGFMAGTAKADVIQYTLELDASASTFSIFAQVLPENGVDFDSGGLGNVTLQIHGLNEATDTITMLPKTVVYGGVDPVTFIFGTKTVGLALPLGIPPEYIGGVLNGAILQVAGDVAQPGLGQIEGLLFPATSDINGTQQPNLSPIVPHASRLNVAIGNFSSDINGITMEGSAVELLNLDNTAYDNPSETLFETLIINDGPELALGLTLEADPAGGTFDMNDPVWGTFYGAEDMQAHESGTITLDYTPDRDPFYSVPLVVSFDLVDATNVQQLVDDLNALATGGALVAMEATAGPGGLPQGDFFVTFNGANVNSEGTINFSFPGFEVQAVAIPEPATMSLFVLGGLALVRRRRNAA